MKIKAAPIRIAVEKVIIRHELEMAMAKLPKNGNPIAVFLMHAEVYKTHMMLFHQRYNACHDLDLQNGTSERQLITLNSGVSPDDIKRIVAEIAEQDGFSIENCGNTKDLPDAGAVIH